MRKFLALGAVIAALTLVLAGCSSGDDNGGPSSEVTGITLKVAQVGGAETALNKDETMAMVSGTVREFTAEVKGKGKGYDKTYTITVSGTGFKVDGAGTEKATVTVTGSSSNFTVTAASTKKPSITASSVVTQVYDPADIRDPAEDKPPASSEPIIAGIILKVARSGAPSVSDKITQLASGETRVFSAEVIGYGNFSDGYTIEATGTPADAITKTDGTGSVTVTAGSSGSFTVTATAVGDTTKKDSWTINIVSALTEEDPTDPSKGEIITIFLKADGSPIKPENLGNGAKITFTAQVTGKGPFDSSYTISATGTGVTIAGDGDTVTVTAIEDEGSFTVTAASNGNSELTAKWEDIPVIAANPFANPVWVIRNTVLDRNKAIDPQTTKTVSEALDPARKRYVIFNNEPGATIDNQPDLVVNKEETVSGSTTTTSNNCFRDVTVMYLDVPINVKTGADFAPFGIQARIRVTGHRDSAPLYGSQGAEQWGGGQQGFVMGYIKDPSAPDFVQEFEGANNDSRAIWAKDAPPFQGFRILSSGQHRIYSDRNNGSGYGSQTLTVATGDTSLDIPNSGTPAVKYQTMLEAHDYANGGYALNTGKKEGFRDQEYVVRITRTGETSHIASVYDSTGTTELFKYTPGGTVTTIPGKSLTNVNNYLAFLVYGVKAEISDIKILRKG